MKRFRFVVEADLELHIPGVSDAQIEEAVKPYIGKDLDLMLPFLPGMPAELKHLKLESMEIFVKNG